MAARVLMMGYYGRGNFGDDVLMLVTHRLLKQALPNAEIHVLVDGEDADYVRTMLEEVTLLKPGRHGHFDLIVHGGGGVFFDFGNYGKAQRMLEYVCEAIGYRSVLALENVARSLFGKTRTSATRRIGLGIGVGTFSPGSPRIREKLSTLVDMDALWLRDRESVENLQRFASLLSAEIIEGSDLAFLTEHWRAPPTQRARSEKPKLGIVLRDWPRAHGGMEEATLAKVLASLAEEYELTGFIFDRHADPITTRALAPYATYIWNPHHHAIADFSAALAAQDVLLTSRAHGAICGACLGVPCAIVAIEPKLAQVHAMIPNSSRLIEAQAVAQWKPAIEAARNIDAATIAAEVEKNRTTSQAALTKALRWLP